MYSQVKCKEHKKCCLTFMGLYRTLQKHIFAKHLQQTEPVVCLKNVPVDLNI